MKRELDGKWIPYRLGFRPHLKKMTGNEVKLWNFYLLSVDHHSWVCGFPTAYLAKALSGSEHTWVKAKRGLVEKGYIEKRGQTNIYIPRLKKFKKQAETEISAPLLARIETLEKLANTAESAVNTAESAVNTAETAPLTRKKEKQTKAGGKDLFVRNKNFKVLVRWLTEQNEGRDMTALAKGTWLKYGEKTIERAIKVVDRVPNPNLKTFWEAVKGV